MLNLGPLPENVTIIEVDDRNSDGFYEIAGGRIDVHVVTINIGGQVRIAINQTPFRQSLSLRAWISGTPFGEELFFRFHPGTGGVSHLLFDKDLNPTPILVQSPIQRSLFTGQEFRFSDNPVPLVPGVYFYNVQNLEGKPDGYKIAFIGPGLDC